MRAFLKELRRRHVPRALFLYLAGAFALLQAADLIFPLLGVPESAVRLVLALALLGLPVALALAWRFEFTRDGIERHDMLDAEGTSAAQRGAAPLVAAVAVLVIAGAYAWLARGADADGGAAGSGEARERSIAVLPFQHISGAAANDYFADGITEDIITQLAQVADLMVTSRTSVMTYKQSPLDTRTIASQLGVRHILEGTVRRDGNTVRIVAQLIDAETDRHVWADTFDRDLSDAFRIQSEVAREIAGALQARLSPVETARMDAALTNDPRAYDLYLRARAMWGSSYETNLAALALQREAIALDPDFASAHAHLSYGYTELVENFGRPLVLLDTAVALAQEAIRIAPDHFQGHNALGYALFHQGRLSDSYAAVRLATQLNPGSSDAMSMMALLERELGDPAASIDWAQRGFRTDPLAAWHPNHLLIGYLLVGDYDEAERWLSKGREVAPDYPWLEINGGWLDIIRGRAQQVWARARVGADAAPTDVLSQTFAMETAAAAGEWEAARPYGERLLALNPTQSFGEYRLTLAAAYARLGERERARSLSQAVIEETRAEFARSGRPQLGIELGLAYALAGDAQAAFSTLERAFQTGYASPDDMMVWTVPDEFKSDPRFTRLVERQREKRDVFRRRLGLAPLGE